MTKAKRYEGEQARSDMWHRASRDKAWEAKRRGGPLLADIVHKKFNVYCETRYNAETCSYDIVTEVAPGGPTGPMGHLPPLEILLTHAEDYMVFPSDHLKTKLLLIAG